MKIRRLLVSSFVAITAVLGAGYGAFECWVTLKANALPKAVTEGKLTEIRATDVERLDSLVNLLAQSPLPWHQQQAHHFNDLLEVADAAYHTFGSERVKQLRVGQLLTLQQEMEDYVQRYPNQPHSEELQQELPAIRSLVTFFPIIKASAGERSVDSALRASRRGATLAALVIRRVPEVVIAEAVAETTPALPEIAWTKAENDVLYDYSQALQSAERDRLNNDDRVKIGRQICSWLETGQGYWSVRSLFDLRYKSQIAGDYYHNRDAYIRFGTERLCPQHVASLLPPAENSGVQLAKTPAITQTATAVTNTWNAATSAPGWVTEAQAPQYGQVVPPPFVGVPPGQGGVVPGPGFPGGFR